MGKGKIYMYCYYEDLTSELALWFRILVDLPTAENRVKILRVILSEEELEPNFDFEELARMTEGYSGSDLKVSSEPFFDLKNQFWCAL